MKKQTKIKRLYIFIKRNIKSIIFGFHYKSLLGMYNGPKVIVNSLPKCGTNLVDRAILFLPYMRRKVGKTIQAWNIEEVNLAIKKINNLKKGQYLTSHVVGNQEIFNTMEKKNIIGIMIIRDPRSKIISHYNYVTHIDTNHRTHEFFKKMNSDSDRIDTLINGKKGICGSIDEELKRYNQWLTRKDILVLKFENLVGEKGGGDNKKQFDSIKKIVNHLKLSVSDYEITNIQVKIFSTKSPTFRKAEKNEWKYIFNENQKNVLKNKIGKWLIDYGYEDDYNW